MVQLFRKTFTDSDGSKAISAASEMVYLFYGHNVRWILLHFMLFKDNGMLGTNSCRVKQKRAAAAATDLKYYYYFFFC